ncbi:MAG TPA: sodium:solute symporter family protein [Acidilobales archaeon]|nr:sodium:solute symporter family protein [Acidilobales archaeon]
MIAEFITVLIIYIAVGTLIALVSRRFGVKTTSEYFVAGYRLGGLLAAMTYAATTYSAFMMIGLVGFAYATGVGALGFELAYLLATLILLTLFGRHVWFLARERKWVSPSEMLSDLYGFELMGITIAVIYLVALIPYISAQVIGIGKIFEGIGVGYEVGVCVGVILAFLWIVIAGIWSIATTDMYQGAWMITAASIFIIWLLAFFIPSNGVDYGELVHALSSKGLTGITEFWSLPTFLAFTIPWVFFAVTNPQVVQRVFMPANERSLKRLIQYFSIYGLIYTLIVTAIGLMARGLTELGVLAEVSRDLVTPTLLLHLNPVLASIVYVSIVAAAISTINSIVLSVASSFVRDLYERRVRVVDPRRSIRLANLVVAWLVIAAAVVAYFRPGFIVEMSVLSSVILLPLAPITIAAWLCPSLARQRVSRILSYVALIVGVAMSLYAAISLGPKKAFVITYMGLPLSAWILIATSVIVLLGFLMGYVSASRK